MEIARAAAGLFAGQGLKATRAEDIARAAGVAPRTFYRYFATKEEAVAPLYAAGARRWAEALREAPATFSPPEALEYAVRHTLTPSVGVSASLWEWVRTLVRLAHTSPGLRKVWAEVCQASEQDLAEILAARARDNVAMDPARDQGVTPELRFTAAVAGAAVRVAVESWSMTDAAACGPEGPTALALRNLGALQGFSWGAAGEVGDAGDAEGVAGAGKAREAQEGREVHQP
ncbi:TetR family transcriptional regulator [Streptomyces sp. NPDC046805]|uniref:TetR/AcrR family transcriptional regulator n=1 Tax=Streptomyces sp. NPDC046805 TaxID=3155134 RepID=UPI0033DB8061